MRTFKVILFSAILASLFACDEEGDVFEEIKKLRGLGVAISPLIGVPSTAAAKQTVTLTLHAAVPKGETIKIETFEDEASVFDPNIQNLTLKANSEVYQDFSTLRHYSVQATFEVPTLETLKPVMHDGAVNLRYAFKLTSGAEEEKIIGKVVVLDPDSEEGKKTWKDPTFAIKKPSDSDKIGRDADVDISATVKNENKEEVKIGWFVSGGKLKNRRARETTWETSGADKQLLIGTVRGKRSHSFAIDIKEYSAK